MPPNLPLGLVFSVDSCAHSNCRLLFPISSLWRQTEMERCIRLPFLSLGSFLAPPSLLPFPFPPCSVVLFLICFCLIFFLLFTARKHVERHVQYRLLLLLLLLLLRRQLAGFLFLSFFFFPLLAGFSHEQSSSVSSKISQTSQESWRIPLPGAVKRWKIRANPIKGIGSWHSHTHTQN